MRKPVLLFTLALVSSAILFSYRSLPVGAVIYNNSLGFSSLSSWDASQQPGESARYDVHSPYTLPVSCANPRPQEESKCHELEQRILDSTVRFALQRWVARESGNDYTFVHGNMGLATLKEGRYLITHNHHGISLSDPKKDELINIYISPANGEASWVKVHLQDLTIVAEGTETLVLDLGSKHIPELQDMSGLSSSDFQSWESLPLHPGTEVAHVNWDGKTVRVDWVKIDKVIIWDGTPTLKLDDFAAKGASGGGVFWNGYHIANTWLRVTTLNKTTGVLVDQYSVAALNLPDVIVNSQ